MSYPIICLQIFHFTKWKCNKNYKYVVYEVSTFLCPIKADINMMEENMKKKTNKKAYNSKCIFLCRNEWFCRSHLILVIWNFFFVVCCCRFTCKCIYLLYFDIETCTNVRIYLLKCKIVFFVHWNFPYSICYINVQVNTCDKYNCSIVLTKCKGKIYFHIGSAFNIFPFFILQNPY